MRKSLRLATVAAIAVVASACKPHTVPSGSVGVQALWGAVQPDVLPEGLYWVYVGKSIIDMDARVQKKEVNSTASSKDLQVVTAVIALNYRIVSEKAPDLYQDIGVLQNVEKNIIAPVLQEAVKTATARYNAEELITKRSEVKESITNYVKQRLEQSNLYVTDLSIVDFQFAQQYQEAIERKQVAEQQALTAGNDLKRIEVEAKQQEARSLGKANALLIEAKAEAERQELLRKTITPDLVSWEAIQKWNGQLPVVQGNGAGAIIDIAAISAARK